MPPRTFGSDREKLDAIAPLVNQVMGWDVDSEVYDTMALIDSICDEPLLDEFRVEQSYPGGNQTSDLPR